VDPRAQHAGEFGNNFFEQFEAFSNLLRGNIGQPREIPARVRQAFHKPRFNRVTHRRDDDGDRVGGVFSSQSFGSNGSDNDVNLKTDEISGESREAIASPLRISVLNADVLSLNPSEFEETLPECLVPERGIGRRE
jgi:hypothetical protein